MNLSDQVLFEITTLLPYQDKIRLERVSTQWLNALLKTWRSLTSILLDGDVPFEQVAKRTELCMSRITKLAFCGGRLPNLGSDIARFGQQFNNVTEICFAGNDLCLTSEILTVTANCFPNLRSLSIEHFHGTHKKLLEHPVQPDFDSGLSAVMQQCRKLSNLNLHIDRVPTPEILALLNAEVMQQLSLITGFYRADRFEDLFTWIRSLKNLHCLELSMCFDQRVSYWWGEELLVDFLSQIGANCLKLQRLRLNLLEYYHRDEFPLWRYLAALQWFPESLTDIDLGDCEGLESVDIRSVAFFCPELKHLNLSDAIVGKETALEFLAVCSKLEYLNVSRVRFCRNMDYFPLNDSIIQNLVCLQNLKSLVADGCIGISSDFFSAVFPATLLSMNLKSVSFKECPGLSQAAIWAVYQTLHGVSAVTCQPGAHTASKLFKLIVSETLCGMDGNGEGTTVASCAHGVSAQPFCGLWYSGGGRFLIALKE